MSVIKHPHHLDMDGHGIGNLRRPESDNEAATKGYVDSRGQAVAAYVDPKSKTFAADLVESLVAAGLMAAE